jgi:hypothetical protein
VIKWFEGNPVAIALASMSALLMFISLMIGVIWSFPPRASVSESGNEGSVAALDVPEIADSEPLETYAVITERPVFNQSRLPVIEEDVDEEEEPEEEVEAPEVQLSGVIITPTLRMATLRSAEMNESLVAFEGQPLEGNFGSWQVSQINAREVTLSSAAGESLQLRLEVHNAQIAAPPKMAAPDNETQEEPAAEQGENQEPLSRAEEIRQRIAQRREELKRAAEEKEADEKPEVDYRSAIQSMVNSSSRRKKEEDGNQQ